MTLDLDPERKLALAYVPRRCRAALEALWQLDAALGAVLATGRDPMISRIRLAWWREALEKLDRHQPPAEPVLQALARLVLPAGVSGPELAAMEEGWAALLAAGPLERHELDVYAERRGGRLFALSACLLGAEADLPTAAGEAWALVDLARRSTDKAEGREALRAARSRREVGRWPAALRPLGMLAVLARWDCEHDLPLGRQGAPARMVRMLAHRLTGR